MNLKKFLKIFKTFVLQLVYFHDLHGKKILYRTDCVNLAIFRLIFKRYLSKIFTLTSSTLVITLISIYIKSSKLINYPEVKQSTFTKTDVFVVNSEIMEAYIVSFRIDHLNVFTT